MIACTLTGGMVLMGARYVVTLRSARTVLELTTLMPRGLRKLRVPAAHARLGPHHAPMVTGRQHVNAPWQTLHLAGNRVPVVLDLQATHYDEQMLRMVLSHAAAEQEKTTANSKNLR